MPTASDIFDKTYSFGSVSDEDRLQSRSNFICAVDSFLRLPITSLKELNCQGIKQVFIAYSYKVGSEEHASITCSMLAIEDNGNLVKCSEHIYLRLTSTDHSYILRRLRSARTRWENRFSVETIIRHKKKSAERQVNDTSYSAEEFSLTPYEKSRFFDHASNAHLYRMLVAPYSHLTKRGSKKERGRLYHANPDYLPRVFVPAIVAIAKPFWEFRRKHLRPDILSALASLGRGQLYAYYNWLNAQGDEIKSQRRMQAAKAFPVFFNDFLEKDITGAIDSGVELIPFLAKRFTSSSATIKFLGGKTNQMVCAGYYGVGPLLSEKLKDVPIDLMPSRKKEWEILRSIDPIYLKSVLRCGFPKMVSLSSKRNLNSYSMCRLLDDYRRALGLTPSVEAEVFGATSFKRWIEISDKYHSKLRQIEANIREVQDAARREAKVILVWEPLAPAQEIGNGKVSLRFLTSYEELCTEALEMDHCVNGYSEYCLFHCSHIASLNYQNGSTVQRSTAQIVQKDGKLVIRQHFKEGNEDPGSELTTALNSFVRRINQGDIQIDFEYLAAKLNERRSAEKNYHAQMGKAQSLRREVIKDMARSLLPPASKNALEYALKNHVPEAEFGDIYNDFRA